MSEVVIGQSGEVNSTGLCSCDAGLTARMRGEYLENVKEKLTDGKKSLTVSAFIFL